MSNLLRDFPTGSLMLDVGTGSGVFAIWAAKHGHRVLGVDINPRAISMARQNAIKNGLQVYSRFEDLRAGGICLMTRRFDEAFTRDEVFSNRFDGVFLNPPYNPTCPGVTPALHAESGKDGQRCFDEQIVLAPRVLKEEGRCVGIQMAVKDGGGIRALRKMTEAFGEGNSLRYTHILDREYFPTRKFLEGQYEGYLSGETQSELSPGEVRNYIDEVSKENPELAFIYYEIYKGGRERREGATTKLRRVASPTRGWGHRIEIHRQIVDNTSPQAGR
jgi:SAM-dependent methyltransferase